MSVRRRRVHAEMRAARLVSVGAPPSTISVPHRRLKAAPTSRRRRSVRSPLAGSDVRCGSFGLYRAWDTTLAQNEQRKSRPLTMPVVAIGGAESWVKRPGKG
jgi:hypothetical protein